MVLLVEEGKLGGDQMAEIIDFFVAGCHIVSGFLSFGSPRGFSFKGQNRTAVDPKCVSHVLVPASCG